MDRLQRMDKEAYLREMRGEVERILGRVAEVVNEAPDGHVINASEGPVRDLMLELRKTAYEKAVQMRIACSEANFSPCGPVPNGPASAKQGRGRAERAHAERSDRPAAHVLAEAERGS